MCCLTFLNLWNWKVWMKIDLWSSTLQTFQRCYKIWCKDAKRLHFMFPTLRSNVQDWKWTWWSTTTKRQVVTCFLLWVPRRPAYGILVSKSLVFYGRINSGTHWASFSMLNFRTSKEDFQPPRQLSSGQFYNKMWKQAFHYSFLMGWAFCDFE